MAQLENIEAIEARLWRAADLLRSGSEFASNEYFMPVMGLIFLRHAYSRFLAVKPQIEQSLPSRHGVTRPLSKEDFSQKGSIFLRPEAQFDYFITKASDTKLPDIIVKAMETIEEDYSSLKGVLPKQEYQSIPYDLLGDLFTAMNTTPPVSELRQMLARARIFRPPMGACQASSRGVSCRSIAHNRAL